MIKMATMAIYAKKTFENHLRNRMADDYETWYASLGTWALPRILKC